MTNFEHYKDELKEWANKGGHCEGCLAKNHCDTNSKILCCSGEIIEWGFEEYEPPESKKHTMQEISNFFGRPFAKDEDSALFLYEENPTLDKIIWHGNVYVKIPKMFVSDYENHDWTILVTPKEAHE